MRSQSDDYARIERAIHFLEENFHRQPGLKEIARSVNLSEHHFQRLFRRWAGISPKRLVQFLTLENAKRLLEKSGNLLDTTYDAGLSSPGRLHDLFVNIEGMTPGEFKAKGAGLKISYGFHPSPFGECLLAVTERGVCGLGFVGKGGRGRTLQDFKSRWKEARFEEAPQTTRPYADRIFGQPGPREAGPVRLQRLPRPKNLEAVGRSSGGGACGQSRGVGRRAGALRAAGRNGHDGKPLTLVLKGTNFQIKVWEALLKVPRGALTCYEDLAASIGRPRALRAVGAAVGRNPVAFIIPCHRAIRKAGIIGDYHWGGARKKAILVWEAARTNGDSE